MTEFLQQVTNGLIVGATYALLTIGLTMIFGLMGVLNYAHGEFYMLGGVLAYWIIESMQLDFFISMPVTIFSCFALGFIFEKLLIKRLYPAPIVTTAIVTVGLSMFLQNVVFKIWGNVPRSIQSPFPLAPIEIGGLTVPPVRLFVLAIAVLVIVVNQIIIKRTRLGCAMRATFQDKDAAAISGIPTSRIYTLTFAYGCALAGLSGMLCGSFLTISPFMGASISNKAWAIAIMGGKGNILGAIFGAFLLGVVETLGAGYLSAAYKDAFGFVIVILVLVFRPEGLFTRKARI